MKLVSAEEAKLARLLIEHLHQNASDSPESPLEENVIVLAATVEALWPIVTKAAAEPCTVQNGPCEVWLDDRAQWCSRCLARALKAQVKEAQDAPAN